MYKFDETIEKLNNSFPEMEKIFLEEKEEYEDLPYYFYESEFTKYIVFQSQKKNHDKLEKIFNFVEDMFVNGDEKVKTLVGVAVVESLYFENDFMKHYDELVPFMGIRTKKSFDDCLK